MKISLSNDNNNSHRLFIMQNLFINQIKTGFEEHVRENKICTMQIDLLFQ